MKIRDEFGEVVRYGDVVLVHCAEPGCPDAAFEQYAWRCYFHRKDVTGECLEPGCNELANGGYCDSHSWWPGGRA